MANPTLSQIKVGQTTYDICDATARDSISQTNNSVSQINNFISGFGTTAPGTILWSGTLYMTADHNAYLSHNVSTCPTGIALEWAPYTDGTAQIWGRIHTFVSKECTKGQGVPAILATSKFGSVGTKYVYINDSRIAGHVDNGATGTANGITYKNNY